jgi:hypothetical protein
MLGGPVQIAAIRRERIGRGARLGGHHLEEAFDQSGVGHRFPAHSRAMASAAIMRASPVMPTPLSAAIIW